MRARAVLARRDDFVVHTPEMVAVHETRYVSVASAGTNGYAYFGFLDALEDHLPDYDAWRQGLQGVAGCSAGCICALALALGLTKETRRELEDLFDVGNVVRTVDIARLVKRYGVDDGAGIRASVERTLVMGGLSPHTTLGDVRRLLRVEFVCVCTDLRDGRCVPLSSSETPTVQVCDAIAASCAAPFVYSPQTIDGRYLVDGCMSCTQPTPFDDQLTLLVRTDGDPSGEIRDWQDFLCRIIHCCSMHGYDSVRTLYETYPSHTVSLAVPDGNVAFDVAMDEATRMSIRASGYVSTVTALCHGFVETLQRAVRTYVETRAVLMEFDPEERPPDAGGCAPIVRPAPEGDSPDT